MKKDKSTMIPNKIIHDSRLTLEAKGTFAMMALQGLDPCFYANRDALQRIYPKRAISYLEKFGYLSIKTLPEGGVMVQLLGYEGLKQN